MTFIKVKDIEPIKKPGINIRVRIIVSNEPKTVNTKYGKSRVGDFIVADETDSIVLSLWGSKINEVSTGEILEIKDGYCNVWQGRPKLSLGRDGSMEKIEDDTFPDINTLLKIYKERSSEQEEE